MNNCILCEREYDPSMEFCEDIELLEYIARYVDIEKLCPKCCVRIDNEISTIITEIQGFSL